MGRKTKADFQTKRMFRNPSGQEELFEKSLEEVLERKINQPVECLGITFPNDEERRKYFLEKLNEKLKDPKFRKIDGFPIGSDEDILARGRQPHATLYALYQGWLDTLLALHAARVTGAFADDVAKTNLAAILNQRGLTTVRSL
jgi:hypothetical protein